MGNLRVGQNISYALDSEFEAFLVDRKASGIVDGTYEFYRHKLKKWSRVFWGLQIKDVLEITPQHIRHGIMEFSQWNTPGEVHACFRVLRAFLRWYEQEYEPDGWANPIRKVKAPKISKDPLPPVPLEHVQAMINVCDKSFTGQRDKAILMALLDTGSRVSEFLAMNIGDMDENAIVIRRGKGGKRRVVFLGNKTRVQIARYLKFRGKLEPEDPLWITDENTRLKYQGLRKILVRRSAQANIPEPSPHDFRRAFALLSLRGGMDVYSLQRLMGHADLDILRRYLAQTEQDLREAHAKAGPVDRLL